jgi:predicted enzyme related to lactoylglutathione lyase
MTLKLGMITVDTTDAERLAGWWSARLDARVTETHGGWYVVLAGGGLPALLSFQKVDDPTPGKNKLHLDLVTDDLEASVDELVGAGAAVVERRDEGGFAWVTLTDPDGNEFCVSAHEHSTVPLER